MTMETEEHLLSLKVMRLTRPSLSSPIPVTCDSKDLPGNLLNHALQQDPAAVHETETLNVGQFLLIPQNPVETYLGETFSSIICIYNESSHAVNSITVKVDLQTASQILVLSQNPPIQQLQSGQTHNIVIHHEVKEIGTHILVCEVAYQTTNKTMSFRKIFKIQVQKPLCVKTKFYNAEDDNVYLEAQVQNLTSGPIHLENVALNASILFKVTSLSRNTIRHSIFGKTVLQPQCIYQYLYRLTPVEKLSSDLKSLSGATNIGKLDIIWRSSLGETGVLQTFQLQRLATDYGEVHMTIIEIPNIVVLEELFTFTCKLVNNSERAIEFMLFLENTDGIAWCDISGQKIESLSPHSHRILEFKCIILRPGLRTISGIKLLDTFLKRTYTCDKLGPVFVITNK